MYFYNDLIKYLTNEDDLMGVMSHEMAHSDKRHSVRQLQREYGVDLLLSIAQGKEPNQAAQILTSLGSLTFSGNAETEADEESVKYKAKRPSRSDGAETFFKKSAALGQSGGPVFSSTHRSPKDRVENIIANAAALGCDTTYYTPSSCHAFVNLLPQSSHRFSS
jgi:predicted Zn-dependent protease